MEGMCWCGQGPRRDSLQVVTQGSTVYKALAPSSSCAFLTAILQHGHSFTHQTFPERLLSAWLLLEEWVPAPEAMQTTEGGDRKSMGQRDHPYTQ